jgi:NAD(P)-dependent dehydrogenase (short-subunit alcohol dehydrogenase family)
MKHVVITGANRGIGLELARHYQSEGWRVTGVCRESSSELDEVAKQIIEGIDVTSKEFVDLLVAALQGQTIDLLINNAGVLLDETLGELDFDSLRLQMEINAFAPLKISEALLPNMTEGSKIANITSRMGSIADNSSGGAQLHPGFVKTRMVNFGGLITPQESAAGLVERIEALNLENSGSFWHCNGEELPW